MSNPAGTADVPLTIFGGAVTEMNPEDLPEGSSPYNQDVDYDPGSVFTRAGRKNQYYYANLFSRRLAGFAQSISTDPDEAAWANPLNATLDAPPAYAAVTLNFGGGTHPGAPSLDGTAVAQDNDPGATAWTVGPASPAPALANEWALLVHNSGGSPTVTTPGFAQFGGTFAGVQAKFLGADTSPVTVSGTQTPSSRNDTLATFFTNGSPPTVVQEKNTSTPTPTPFDSNTTPGNTILVVMIGGFSAPLGTLSVADNNSGVYNIINQVAAAGRCTLVAVAQNIIGGNHTQVTISGSNFNFVSGSIAIYEVANLAAPPPTNDLSEILNTLNYSFSLPESLFVLGFQVEITGHQDTLAADAILTISLADPPLVGITTFRTQLPLVSDGTVTVGVPLETWGLALTPELLNNPSFAINIVASALDGTTVAFNISAVRIKAWLTPNPPANFNWIKTYEQDNGATSTLLLDANGILWNEDVDNTPGVLDSIFTAIEPATFAKSVTFQDVEYIALSNLRNGTDMPRQWNTRWLDRVSQVGPGAPPAITSVSSGSAIVDITQNAAFLPPTSGGGTSGSWISLSAGPSSADFDSSAQPGNVILITFPKSYTIPAYIKVGSNIVLQGAQLMNGYNPNSGATSGAVTNPPFYTVTSVGIPDPNNDYYTGLSFVVPKTGFFNARAQVGFNLQATVATLTAAEQIPNLQVGNSMTVESNSKADYNQTWTVTETPNASQVSITNTSLLNGIATYAYTLLSGAPLLAGRFITIVGTLNGSGVFNVTNGVLNTVGGSTFTIAIPGANVAGAAEDGNGIIAGTIFRFDPAGVVANPIIGTGTGGTIATTGVLGVGVRRCVCIFKTRNLALTQPSPYVEFNITGNATSIVASQIPIGPPNTIARVLAFTGANGGNYFYIAQDQTVTSNGQKITYTSTVVNDNTTTQANFSFPDGLLLESTAIDIPGNDLFGQIELGSSLGFTSYSNRLIAWGEQNKVQNFLNLSFDGGVGTASTNLQQLGAPVTTFPLGWTVDPVNGGGGSVAVSPQFGNSYYVLNTTGAPQALFGMIEQSAFQNQLGTPIIRPSTLYSVRVTARCPSQAASGALVMDLFSPATSQVYGSFSVPLASMATTMNIFTGTLLTTNFGTVPNDLLFRVYVSDMPVDGDVELDRVEPFPTLEPVFNTQFRGSYAFNLEAFELVTGAFGPNQNMQPIRGAAVLFDLLFALKTTSLFSTSDNGVTEPSQWGFREVSNKVGTIGPHSYDYGEGWLVTACRPGIYFFNGGDPIPLSQEFSTVWNLINWDFGHTIWLRNDTTNKVITCGIPIATGPGTKSFKYLPEMPAVANPTSPNVVLAISYKELNTGGELASSGAIRGTSSGRLVTSDPSRKLSFWNIRAPYADFISRANNESPLFLCTGYEDSKVFALDPDELSDDGAAINSFYLTYGFVRPEQGGSLGIGAHRSILQYLTTLATGIGDLNIWIYPETPLNELPYILEKIPLDLITAGDLESDADVTGQRFFLRYGTNAVGSRFELSKLVASMAMDKWSPIRGSAK